MSNNEIIEKYVKEFCQNNAGKSEISFELFKNPNNLIKELKFNINYSQFKGEIFEKLLEELFVGNGYLVERIGKGGNDEGCDLLIKYPQDNSIRFILQAKNWNKNIDKYDIKKEYAKFADNYKNKFNLNSTNFCFVSWNFVKEIKYKINHELNIKVWDEQDITNNLFKNYQPTQIQFPSVILEPYQQLAFNNTLEYWSRNKRCYIEHATGTGKTYIIAKLVQYFLNNSSIA